MANVYPKRWRPSTTWCIVLRWVASVAIGQELGSANTTRHTSITAPQVVRVTTRWKGATIGGRRVVRVTIQQAPALNAVHVTSSKMPSLWSPLPVLRLPNRVLSIRREMCCRVQVPQIVPSVKEDSSTELRWRAATRSARPAYTNMERSHVTDARYAARSFKRWVRFLFRLANKQYLRPTTRRSRRHSPSS